MPTPARASMVRGMRLCPIALSLLGTACGAGDLGEPPAHREGRVERWLSPPAEPDACDGVGSTFRPPAHVLDLAAGGCDPRTEAYCFRLAPELRRAARELDAVGLLAASALAFDRAYISRLPGDEVRARALADLAVSGRRHALELVDAHPETPADVPGPASSASKARALHRAYAVLWALRGPPAARAALRPGLGYVAVSPEDAPPDRPVNIMAGDFPQSDLHVDVELEGYHYRLRTRVLVASSALDADGEIPPSGSLVGMLPRTPGPRIPAEGPVVISVHGHASLAEETIAMIRATVAEARSRGEALTVVAMDLPSNAYAEHLDPSALPPGEDAALRLLDQFLLGFVDALEARQPGFRDRVAAVSGGSLGGNLVLRLAREPSRPDWARRIMVWSPASIDWSWGRARLIPEPGSEFFDVVKHEAVRMTRDAATEPEKSDSRRAYFTADFTGVRSQADYWYRDGLRCKRTLIREGLTQLSEVYGPAFRRWHYRIAHEQLLFSHIEADPLSGVRPFERIRIPLLLVTGEEDDRVPMTTYRFVRRLAPYLAMPGQTLFLEDTGHAMHSERPRFLADHLLELLDAPEADPIR